MLTIDIGVFLRRDFLENTVFGETVKNVAILRMYSLAMLYK